MNYAEALVRSVVVAMMVLENASDSDLDPDVAVRGLESIVDELSKIAGQDRPEFLRVLRAVQQAEAGTPMGLFAGSLPTMIGFEAEEARDG
ncbi:hypothetical protein ACIGB8_09050 [Promicromonospora sukumoe]|uniref:hypothetical protein n=1 Tax=Promicromonospora sukumoe TaxID=88382 RepID=UPI0037C5B8D7